MSSSRGKLIALTVDVCEFLKQKKDNFSTKKKFIQLRNNKAFQSKANRPLSNLSWVWGGGPNE